jgi:predicted DNA-binding transcriptional regulator AlpA
MMPLFGIFHFRKTARVAFITVSSNVRSALMSKQRRIVMIHFQIGISLESDAVNAIAEIVRLAVERQSRALREEEEKRNARLEQSRTALFAGQKPPENVGLLIDTPTLSKLLKMSASLIWKMEHDSRMPSAVRVGRSVRWGLEEIQAWVKAGCPERAKWKWPF